MSRLATIKGKKTDLSGLAHQQTMDLLRLGDKSKNPAIAEAAVEIAKERERAFHASARLAPTRTAATLVSVVVAVAIGLCWYVLLVYPRDLADRLLEVVICGAVAIICLYLLIYGHLTQANFMKIVEWVMRHFRTAKGSPSSSGHSEVPLKEGLSASAEPEDEESND
jgi:hypothetical protein